MEDKEVKKETIKSVKALFRPTVGVTGPKGPGPCPKGVRLSDGTTPDFGTMYADTIENNNCETVILRDGTVIGNPIDVVIKEGKVLFGPSNPYKEDEPVKKKTMLEKYSEWCGYTVEDKENEKKLNKFKSRIFNMLKLHTSDDRPCEVIEKNKKDPVLQDWVMSLNWKMQTALISAIRGYDNDIEVEDNTDVVDIKSVVKMIRFLVLRNADSNTRFMSKYCLPENEVVSILVKHVEQCIKSYSSLHWVKHIVMAIDIIMNYHHSSYVQHYWLNVGKKFNKELNNMLTFRIL